MPTNQDHVLTFEHVKNFSGRSGILQDRPIEVPQCYDQAAIMAKDLPRTDQDHVILVGRRSSPESETGASMMGADLAYFFCLGRSASLVLKVRLASKMGADLVFIYLFIFLSWLEGALSPEGKTGA